MVDMLYKNNLRGDVIYETIPIIMFRFFNASIGAEELLVLPVKQIELSD
ncbi:hypothetical protein [Jeotgalibacillus marinus]|uniref:Uncharacterized protein n=1 Tax=Jeotgalibacillus marinus TaxID=86667 RepID=A0ABV3Q5Z6_9BACL